MSEATRCCNIKCARLFIPSRSASYRGGELYCSQLCWAATRRKKLHRRTCPACGEQFFVRGGSRQISCSIECRGVMLGALTTLVRCERCHSLFDRPHECVGEQRETYGFSAIALAEVWS